MITVKYSSAKKNKITISGHAVGKDDVCTASSMLLYTLAETLQSVEGTMLKKNTLKLVADVGKGEVSCRPKPEYRANIDLVFYTIINGYQLLSESYPKDVKLVVIGE